MVLITVDETYTRLFKLLMKQNKIQSTNELFSSQTKNSDRVKIATNFLRENGLLPGEKLLKSKSLEKSIELRNSGNKAFTKKDDKGALILYTRSIAAAPFPSDVELANNENVNDALAIALANRSAVLFAIGKYELCLRDISQALNYNYPKKLLYKLFERQGRCLQRLGRKGDAIESINRALKSLPSATGLTQDKRQTIETELKKLLKCFKSSKSLVKLPGHELPQLPSCSYGKNHEMPCASDCVELKYSPEMGRYLSATRDIQPGDVIAVEKPFASFISLEKLETHCYNCLQRSEALLPCCFCSDVMYCSEKCRSLSWNESHFILCSLLPTLQKLEITHVTFLALKVVIMASKTKDLKNMLASLEAEESERNKGFNSENCYSSSNYGPIYWLEGHTEKRDFVNVFQRSVRAACILHCLETMTDLFSDNDVDHFKYEVGGLLLRHLQNLPCNAHKVLEMVKINAKPIEGVSQWESEGIGAAVYSVLSLMNHSCDPNVSRYYCRGDFCVVRAIRPITTNDQVFDSYGFHYAMYGKAERISQLESQFYFTCKCNACAEDWPVSNLLPAINSSLILCNRCKHVLPTRVPGLIASRTATCINCNKTCNFAGILAKIAESSKKFFCHVRLVMAGKEDTDWNEVSQEVIKYLLLLDENVKQPCWEYLCSQETLKECFNMTGNIYNPDY